MVVADLVTPRISNQIRNRNGQETYEQLNSFCPKCKSPLIRRTIQGRLLSPNFSFGLISVSNDSFVKAIQEPIGSQQQNPTGRFLCFTSTELSSSTEEDSSPFDCCTIARAKKMDKKPGDVPGLSSENGKQESTGKLGEESGDDMSNNDIRSELSFCVTCQAYVASERVISEHQQAFSELVDRLAVDDEGTAFMNLYVANESNIFDDESKSQIDLLSVLKEDYSFDEKYPKNEMDDPSGLSTVITSNTKPVSENNIATEGTEEKTVVESEKYDQKQCKEPVISVDNSNGFSDSHSNSLDLIKRREIIAEALGAKLVEGYSLTKFSCEICGVPLLEQNGISSCFACPALQLKGMAMAYKTMNLPRAQKLAESQYATNGSQSTPAISFDAYKASEFGTRFEHTFLSHDGSNPIFPHPRKGWKYYDNDPEWYPLKYAENSNTGFHPTETLAAIQATAATKPSQRIKYADCRYCGSPCFEQESHAECSECRDVLYGNRASTRKPAMTVPTFAQGRTGQGRKLGSFNLFVTPTENMEYSKSITESRGEISSNRERNEVIMGREGGRHPYAEQVHNAVVNIGSIKNSAKKKLKKKSKYPLEKLDADDLKEVSEHHLWWAAAISAEDSKLDNIKVPHESISYDGSLNADSSYQEGNNEKVDEEESKNESSFEVLDATKTWNSISSESFESASTLKSHQTDLVEKNDLSIMENKAPVASASQTSLSLDEEKSNSAGLTRTPGEMKKEQANKTMEDERFLPLPELQPVNTMAMHKEGKKIMGEPHTSKTEHLLCLPTSLTSLDFSNTSIQGKAHGDQPVYLEASKTFTGTYEEMLGQKHNTDLHEWNSSNNLSSDRTSAEICRLLGCGWKLSSDLHCRKCLMPMMRKTNENLLKCASCDTEFNHSLDPLPPLKKHSQVQHSKTSNLSLSKWNVSSNGIHQNSSLTSSTKLGIGKKLLENWSLVTTRRCDECGGPIMKAPSTLYEGCINSKCACSNPRILHSPKSAEMVRPKFNGDILRTVATSTDSVNTDLLRGRAEFQPQIHDENALKFWISQSSSKSALEKLQTYLQHSDDDSAATYYVKSGEMNIESKLKAQIDMAEFLAAQKAKMSDQEETDFTAAPEFIKTNISEGKMNIESKLKAQMNMADFLWSLAS